MAKQRRPEPTRSRRRGPATPPIQPPSVADAPAPPRFAPFPDLSPQLVYRRMLAVAQAPRPVETRPGRRPLILQADVRDAILQRIRVGAFEWVAVAAAGVSQRTFQYWLAKGLQGVEPYVQFFHEVEQARGQARLSAEMRVHVDDPKFWLRVGPGRERPGRPGWTEESREEITTPPGEPIQVEHHLRLDDDQYREIARLAALGGLLPEPGDEGEADAPPAE